MSIDFAKMQQRAHDQGIQRPKLPADDGGGYTGNQTLYMQYVMRELLISNDDATADLTVTVTGPADYTFTFTLQAGDILDERFYPFDTVAVTATGAWRYIVRSGQIT